MTFVINVMLLSEWVYGYGFRWQQIKRFPHPGGKEVAMTKESFTRNNMSQYSKARPLTKHQCLLNEKEALSNKFFASKPFYSKIILGVQ